MPVICHLASSIKNNIYIYINKGVCVCACMGVYVHACVCVCVLMYCFLHFSGTICLCQMRHRQGVSETNEAEVDRKSGGDRDFRWFIVPWQLAHIYVQTPKTAEHENLIMHTDRQIKHTNNKTDKQKPNHKADKTVGVGVGGTESERQRQTER